MSAKCRVVGSESKPSSPERTSRRMVNLTAETATRSYRDTLKPNTGQESARIISKQKSAPNLTLQSPEAIWGFLRYSPRIC